LPLPVLLALPLPVLLPAGALLLARLQLTQPAWLNIHAAPGWFPDALTRQHRL